MEAFFGSIWWLIVSLGILVTFHEYGHYWVARRCGVRVLRFSIGFGKPLWQRQARDGTVYQVAAIPLGGYVKMLDEREAPVPPEHRHEAFNTKGVWQRIAIVAAGPGFNLILCLALLWAMFIIGKPDYQPLVGNVEGPAAAAGFERGDLLLRVDQREVDTWTDAMLSLMVAAIDQAVIDVRVRDEAGVERTRRLDFASAPRIDERNAMREIGFVPQQWLLPPVVGAVSDPDNPLRPGDRIERIDGRGVGSWDRISGIVADQATPGRALSIDVLRDGQRLSFPVQPRLHSDEAGERWVLGITAQAARAEYDALLRHGPIAAVPAAAAEAWRMTSATFGMLWRMVTGAASLRNISGPITIAQYANSSAGLGVAWFLNFLALLSLSLAIINLLPIPILDGGHLLYYFTELIKGSPVTEKTMLVGQYIGLAMLALLMGLAFYNDILRLFGA